jgi:alpha-D-xyloside xylohydrolase
LLFAPIIAAGGSTQVYFPAGENWVDVETGEWIAGGSVKHITRPLDGYALFGREGHVLCLGRAVVQRRRITGFRMACRRETCKP